MAPPQRLGTLTDPDSSETVTPSEKLTGTSGTPEATAETVSAETAVTQRKPLLFDPEPTQRMVVVRRRKRRRSRQIDKSEQAAGRVRLVLFGLVVVLLIVAVSGQHFALAFLEQLKDILRPLKSAVRAPKLEVVALILAALILIYMMPGVESTVKRWLGLGKPKQKPR